MPRGRVPDEKVYEAAYLRAEMGLSQAEIADRLDVAQATVFRLLGRAKALGCLEESSRHRFVRIPRISDAWMAEMESKLEFADLAKALVSLPTATGLHLRRLRVFDSGDTGEEPDAIDRRQRALGANAALRGRTAADGRDNRRGLGQHAEPAHRRHPQQWVRLAQAGPEADRAGGGRAGDLRPQLVYLQHAGPSASTPLSTASRQSRAPTARPLMKSRRDGWR